MGSAAVDDVFGEPFTYQPMTAAADRNARPAVDSNRAAQTIVAVLIDSYARADSGPARTTGVAADTPGHASARPQLSFDPTQLPYAVRTGDRVLRQSNGALYYLAEPRRPDGVRVLVDLNRLFTAD